MPTEDRDHYYYKGELLEPPLGPGHAQLRPAFLGWQWRISVKGEVFGPWGFAWTRERAERAVNRHTVWRLEVLP